MTDLDRLDTPFRQPLDVDDVTFMENVREAISNGCDMACVWCGIGLAGDGMDMHDRACHLWESVR